MERPYIADLPNEVLVEMIQKMDYPTLTKFCATSQNFRKFSKDSIVQNILIEKEYEYVENNLEYLMSQDKLDDLLADLLAFGNLNFFRGEYDAAKVAYDRLKKILDDIPNDYPILNRFTPFEKVAMLLNLSYIDVDFKNVPKVSGCYVDTSFLPEISKRFELIVFIKKLSPKCKKLYSMSSSSIKSLMEEEEKSLAKKIARVRGPRIRPNRDDNISAILETQEGVFRGEEMTDQSIVVEWEIGGWLHHKLYKLDKYNAYNILSKIPDDPVFKYMNEWVWSGVNPRRILSKYNILHFLSIKMEEMEVKTLDGWSTKSTIDKVWEEAEYLYTKYLTVDS